MATTNLIYPLPPKGVTPKVTVPNLEFKMGVQKVMLSVLFFLFVYVALVVAAVVFAYLLGWLGVTVMTFGKHIFVYILGFGLICAGIMIVFFLFKFLFSSRKVDTSGTIELKQSDEPELFEFIRRITQETHTPFPKKIVISPEVNASVYYNSSFWSMFLPIRKNLRIGLGLVNALNVSEFKAVLAHEFGHFSQRSMKLGSYIYQINQVIYNMLYENKAYSKLLSEFSNLHFITSGIAWMVNEIINGVVLLMRRVYSIINRQYMELSRQMEFHADSVAASVGGGNQLISALMRLEFANAAYDSMLLKINELMRENLRSPNLFVDHMIIMRHLIKGNDAKNKEEELGCHGAKLSYKDQWTTHPTTAERQLHLNVLGLSTPTVEQSTWLLFRKKKELQELLTNELYSDVQFTAAPTLLEDYEFENRVEQDLRYFAIPDLFSEFYVNRELAFENVTEAFTAIDSTQVVIAKSEILAWENKLLPQSIKWSEVDLELIHVISRGEIELKSFDYDGKKYPLSEIHKVLKQIENELFAKKIKLKELDSNLFALAGHIGREKSPLLLATLRQNISAYFDSRSQLEKVQTINAKLYRRMGAVLRGEEMDLNSADFLAEDLKVNYDTKIKPMIKETLHQLDRNDERQLRFVLSLEEYARSNNTYFNGNQFLNSELQMILGIVADINNVQSLRHFNTYKELLLQLEKIIEYQD